ncbi:O-succinylbenzoate synthase [Rothia aeria]|uniref:O-succinylbenzoate synthase n=1 Tax=Rothia aeria TaxID=172042 RepID=A0A2Z5R2S1_9MICC|nr:O-succinylbenzoate synthase [Rothia aeria]
MRPAAPEEARLKALAADHSTRAWWLERIERCWRLLHRGYATADARHGQETMGD